MDEILTIPHSVQNKRKLCEEHQLESTPSVSLVKDEEFTTVVNKKLKATVLSLRRSSN